MITRTVNNNVWLENEAKNQKYIKIFDIDALFGKIVAVSYDQNTNPDQILWFIGVDGSKMLTIDISCLNFNIKKQLIDGVFNNFFKKYENIDNFIVMYKLKNTIQPIVTSKIKKFLVLDEKNAKNILHFNKKTQ